MVKVWNDYMRHVGLQMQAQLAKLVIRPFTGDLAGT